MPEFDELERILGDEAAHGYSNTTVRGGIEQYIERWAEKVYDHQNSGVVDQIGEMVEGYGYADFEERALMIQHALSISRQYNVNSKYDLLQHIDLPSNIRPTTLPEVRSNSQALTGIPNSAQQSVAISTFKTFKVKYKSGHPNIDYFLQSKLKKKDVTGDLRITSAGVEFITDQTKESRKYEFPWTVIRMSSYERVGLLFRRSVLHFNTFEQGRITFEAENAQEIANDTKAEIVKRERERARLEEEKAAKVERLRLDEVEPRRFEELVAELFRAMGYRVVRVGQAGDEGIDLLCWDTESGLTVVQCKRYRGNIAPTHVRDFYGALMHRKAKNGYFVTTSDFSAAAKNFANGKPITLIDGKKLRFMFSQHMNW